MAATEAGLEGIGDSAIVRALEAAMDRNPGNWRSYVLSGPNERLERLFGLSDRVRYYWPDRDVAKAAAKLKTRIDSAEISPGLVSQFADRLDASTEGRPLSERIVRSRVGAIVDRYRTASRPSP
jgi:D-tagatose-1,6-bisphosphate aldolase subunit GatZ/KbaZ